MKKRILLVVVMIAILSALFVISASATTYYVDKDGNLVDSTSKNIAYEYDRTNDNIPNIYLHDSTITKLIIPDMPDYTGTVKLQSEYNTSLGIYTEADKETKANSLITQITEVEVHENIYLDGAYSIGAFSGYTGLQRISFYGTVSVASKGGFFGSDDSSNITEMHFYGEQISVPSKLISSLSHTKKVTIIFHENATGTLSTGGDTLPPYASLNNWKIIINPNIKPSNTSDTRLGAKWGATTSTTGWELIVACNPSLYSATEFEALKTTHGFCSRAASVDTATVMEATVMSYCDALYNGDHNEADDANCETDNDCSRCGMTITKAISHVFENKILYANGFATNGKSIVDCTNAGCTACDAETETAPLFTCLGYSVGPDGYSLKAGFTVNDKALDKYKELYPSFSFGVVMANANTVVSTDSLFVDGSLNSSAKGIMVSVGSLKYVNCNLNIAGFTANNASSLELIVGIYTNDGEGNIKVAQHVNTDKYSTTKSYEDMTLNAITFNQVRVGHGMVALVPTPAQTGDEQ